MGVVSSRHSPSSNKHSFDDYDETFKNSKTNDDYRTHLMHCIFKEIWSVNFLAPVETALRQGAKVLDIGCGAGTWVNDMASDYRSSRFTGVDVLPLFPTVAKPFNVNFVQANILNGLPFEDNSFEYVHCRLMIFDFMESQWDFIYKEICRVLKPGGWIEVVESELGFISEGPYTRSVVEAICQVMKSRKVNPFIISRHEHLLRSVPGLCNISHRQKNYKIGPNSSKIGELLSLNLCETFKEFLISFDGKVEVMDLSNDHRPMSLGGVYNGTYGFDESKDRSNSGIAHKRKSGFGGGRRNRRSGIRRISDYSKSFLGVKKNELKVEMIIDRISKEFDLYQSMTLIHRFWAQKVDTTTRR